ncbi:PICALM [Mytilus coruscus]|uniref:PICALM n=1 Tax=Mytilus coruscus TaxID=42192 RepID=A0A6J8AFU2_MYTCO|nr:PICALM [Mytilus coruscus]
MNKKQCKDGLECYKRFLVRMDKVGEFLKVAENVGIDKGDIPDLAKAPSSLLDALEQHLASLEGKKGVVSTTKPAGFSTAVDAISGNSSFQISEEEKKKILDEENQRLQQLKEYKLKETGSTATPSNATQSPPSTNPFANSTNAPDTNNLLGSPISSQSGNASDDLLSLTGNPFVQNVQQVMAMNNAVNNLQTTYSPGGWSTPPSQGKLL